jgi:hypothetical protein
MKPRYKRSIFAWTSAGWLCLLVACTTATLDGPTGNAEPAGKAASAASPAEEQADATPLDIIDRVFSPLDNAVSDINRDLNKGDTDAPFEPKE